MTTYKNIKGFEIQYLDSDPANPITGQVWYNSTTKALKGTTAGGAPSGTWASGGAMNTARYYLGGNGTQTAALATGGVGPALNLAISEEYNGSSWSEGNDLNTGRYGLKNSGVQTAALSISGKVYPPGGSVVNVESYDGTSYSEITEVNVGRIDACAFGTSTATFLLLVILKVLS